MPGADLHATCIEILREYLANPWAWLRENDLVVDLVARLRQRIPGTVLARLVGPGFAGRLADLGGLVPRNVSRLRTEVKVVTSITDDTKDRCDICVLVDDEVSLVVYPAGVRDVVLKVLEQDVAALLEVKLYSDLYLDHGRCLWLDDLVKLSRIAPTKVLGVLFIDTGLPLASMGIAYRRKRNETTLARVSASVPPWPIPERDPFEVRCVDRGTGTDVTLHFARADAGAEGPGIYFGHSHYERGMASRVRWTYGKEPINSRRCC